MINGGLPSAVERHWQKLVVLAWIGFCIWLLADRWQQAYWFALGDTDDNMRLMQVRGLLAGQGWSDLRQYRLNPPVGADIHWSRFVDLPLAGIIWLLKPLIGGAKAEYVAVATAPFIPLLVAMGGLATALRRMLATSALLVAFAILLFCQGALSMYAPTRIDHHGWQLALLPWLVAGLADQKKARGGATVGLASAISLWIGLEMAPYLAVAAAVLGLRWIADGSQAMRLRAYAAALAGGTVFGFLVFVSDLNRVPRCDALSPVWLSVMLGAGALLALLSFMRTGDWRVRFGAAAIAAALLAGGYALAWPQCLGRLEGISPELNELWFSNIREVKPLYSQNWDIILPIGFSGVIGVVGALFGLWQARGTSRFSAWAGVTLLSLAGGLLLLWQTRAGPAVQMFSVFGATALGWHFLPRMRSSASLLVRVFGTLAAFALVSGLAVQMVVMAMPEKPTAKLKAVSNKANASCSTIPSLAPIARLPKGIVFTFVDLSPRLIVLTHHSAIAGPYHRNGEAILDVHHAFRSSPQEAEAIIRRHGSRYVLICENSSESTLYRADRPNGFYAQLAKGKVPAWLTPITLPPTSPYAMWEVKPPVAAK